MLDSLWNSLGRRDRFFLTAHIVLIGAFLWGLLIALVTAPDAPGLLVERYLLDHLVDVRGEALLVVGARHDEFSPELVGPALWPPSCQPVRGGLSCQVRFPVGVRGEMLVPVLVDVDERGDLLGRRRYGVLGHRLLHWGVSVVLDNPG